MLLSFRLCVWQAHWLSTTVTGVIIRLTALDRILRGGTIPPMMGLVRAVVLVPHILFIYFVCILSSGNRYRLSVIGIFVGEPFLSGNRYIRGRASFGTNGPLLRGPAQPEWYHGKPTERLHRKSAWNNACVVFRRVSEVTGGPNSLKGQQRTCDSSGVAGVHGRRWSLTIRRSVCSFGLLYHKKGYYLHVILLGVNPSEYRCHQPI